MQPNVTIITKKNYFDWLCTLKSSQEDAANNSSAIAEMVGVKF